MRTQRAAIPVLAALLVSLLVIPAPAAMGRGQKPTLPEAARKWLGEDVPYIIAPVEREVFLKLQSDRERDLFIEAFWKQRDPVPETPENEFKTEHFRRLAYANRYFGRDAARPGWRTDRGRIYIILGEPQDIQRFDGRSSTYDAEIWFYQGKTGLGLPEGFNLVFFREGGSGEYKLYSPVADGPQALLTGWFGKPDYESAYKKLLEAEPNLAAVSLSLIPGDPGTVDGRPSMSSDLLIQRIESSPARSIESLYARKFLQYKDIVEVEYTANYLESDSLIKVFRDASGFYFVHYAVEPRRLSVNQYGDKFVTTLKVNGRVTTPDGRLVHQFDKTVSLNLTQEQMAEAGRMPYDFQDLFPLIGGDYSLSLLIKNEASKEFTSVERSLRIPQAGASVELTQPVLGYRAVRLEPAARRMRAFRVGPFQVFCQPGRTFGRKETLTVVFQLNNLADELASSGEVQVAFLKNGQPFREIRRKPADYPDLPTAVEEVSLADFPPAHYAVRVSVASGGADVVTAVEEFDLSFSDSVPRPWFSPRSLPDAGDPSYAVIAGAQLFNIGRYEEARVFLEQASARLPDSEDAAFALARAYMALDNATAAGRTLAPFIEPEKTAKYETYILAAESLRRTGEFGRAAGLAERAVAHFGVNAALMNLMGDCYAGLGKTKEALAAYEKSLELSPDQPGVRSRIDELKKRK